MLQQIFGDRRGARLLAVAGTVLLSGLAGLSAAGCGPIAPEDPEERPPYIDPNTVSPERSNVAITNTQNTNIEFSVGGIYDPNREEELHVIWMARHSGFQRDSTLQRDESAGKITLNKGEFYKFEGTSHEFNPCTSPDLDPERGDETLWVYVSDRAFDSRTDRDFELQPGAFVVSHSWAIEYVCP